MCDTVPTSCMQCPHVGCLLYLQKQRLDQLSWQREQEDHESTNMVPPPLPHTLVLTVVVQLTEAHAVGLCVICTAGGVPLHLPTARPSEGRALCPLAARGSPGVTGWHIRAQEEEWFSGTAWDEGGEERRGREELVGEGGGEGERGAGCCQFVIRCTCPHLRSRSCRSCCCSSRPPSH